MLHLFQIWKGFLSLGVISLWPILEQNTGQNVSLWCIFSLHKEVHHSWSQRLGVITAKADLLQRTKGTEYSSNTKNIKHISGSFSRAEYWRLHVALHLYYTAFGIITASQAMLHLPRHYYILIGVYALLNYNTPFAALLYHLQPCYRLLGLIKT